MSRSLVLAVVGVVFLGGGLYVWADDDDRGREETSADEGAAREEAEEDAVEALSVEDEGDDADDEDERDANNGEGEDREEGDDADEARGDDDNGDDDNGDAGDDKPESGDDEAEGSDEPEASPDQPADEDPQPEPAGQERDEPTFSLIQNSRLSISKKCPPQRYVGTPVKFEITITNDGDSTARDVVVTDKVCETAKFLSASDGGMLQNNRIVWNLGELESGRSKTLIARVEGSEITDLECPARVEWRAMAFVDDKCKVAIVGIPAILLECIDLNDPVEVGDIVTYEITVTNQGSLEGREIIVVATLPDQLEYVTAGGPTEAGVEGQVITFEPLPSLAPKDKATWTLKAKAVGTGDIRFRLDLTSAQSPEKILETESTNLYE